LAPAQIGSSFYAVLCAAGLAVVTSWVNSCGLLPKDYERLPS
jgi:hypothetical protein